ncbi:phage tail assembly protein [Pseudomonas sp. Marseille-Q5115]|uniref:phage tail assembly protein n=1 Tax=Pseudomonas sp. Marseille-Q5115 TaxID=2866593 RepID=UPI001CE41D55|nr:phage tail assembly protein [Pseudomonas sp. Marseille-Q5115]
MSEIIKLSTPIQAHGEEVTELTLRRPTSKEARAIKALPYKIDQDQAVTLDLDVAAKYISACADIPPSSVDQLDLADLNTLAWQVAGFFMTPASAILKA